MHPAHKLNFMQVSRNDIHEIVENAIEKYIEIQNKGKSYMMQLAEIAERRSKACQKEL